MLFLGKETSVSKGEVSELRDLVLFWGSNLGGTLQFGKGVVLNRETRRVRKSKMRTLIPMLGVRFVKKTGPNKRLCF